MNRTKAETLEWLSGRLTKGRVLPLFHFSVADWQSDPKSILARFSKPPFAGKPLIVRSSAIDEDGVGASQAGRFLSVGNVLGAVALSAALDRVIASYGDSPGPHRILVQPMLAGASMSGVVFSYDPSSGAPYILINYSDGPNTAAVTAGRSDGLKTFVCWRGAADAQAGRIGKILALTAELEALLGRPAIDIEFGFDDADLPVVFQARPLSLPDARTITPETHEHALRAVFDKVEGAQKPKPFLHGSRTVFGVMPDWNPAEIIGIRPRPLALSLYRDLVTDSIWAYQRHNYGYKNLRSFPLMIDFNGLPYIDVRVSFNSFVPADVDGDLADRLVNHYIDRLVSTPSLHDKVEFEIVLSCYSFDLPDKLKQLPSELFTDAERATLAGSLRTLTNRIIDPNTGLWRGDARRIDELTRRRALLLDADLDKVARIYWLLEDCKRYGTLPFAGLARAAFIATQILRSLVHVGVLTPAELGRFMANLDTVSAAMTRDLAQLDRTTFLAKYGHLRPGTYDILSPRYDEAPDLYFDWSARSVGKHAPAEPFSLSLPQMRTIDELLRAHGLAHHVVGLFEFLESSIRGREHAKFVFSQSLSDALSLFAGLGGDHGFSVEDMSYADIGCVRRLYAGSENPRDVIEESISLGRRRYEITRQINLPPLITAADQVWRFHQPPTEPNFITQRSAIGAVSGADPALDLDGAIVFLPNADPGFDWVFTRRIAGFVTAYGGANSHMAIRASELGLPAVIGAGEPLYERWVQARRLQIDCLNRQVLVLQ